AGELAGEILNKPGTERRAIAQLRRASGQSASFLTGLCVLDARSGRFASAVERCEVRFRALSDREIRDYVRREKPVDCAGSFKVEGLGITLFEQIRLRDPTALEGLPLIRLTELLGRVGVRVLGA
ncbi:MAG: Maf family protein, partial [Gammaproteobacteria bacterium]